MPLPRTPHASKLKAILSPYFCTSPNQRAISSLSSSNHILSPPRTKPFQKPTIDYPPCSQCVLIIKHFFSTIASQNPFPKFSREGNFDERTSQLQQVCPGCGVHMQDIDPKQPGYFIKPASKAPDYKAPISRIPVAEEPEISMVLKKGILSELVESENTPVRPNSEEKKVVCCRCHSLRHYGRVKDSTVENLLPDFDFDHTIGRKLASATGTRCVVLMVVDAADFDGSFPKKVARLVSTTIDEYSGAWKEGKSGNVPRVVLVLTKLDLLPPSISPTGLEHWVRQRARVGGVNKLTSLHMVSAVKDWGVKDLIEDVVRLAGPRGNVWAIGAQNAGKSTLINAIGKHISGKITHLTEAPVPGTTLGIVKVDGLLPGKAKLFDTPGLLHPHQITTRLTREELKLVQVTKELKPRTYRIKAGHTVHIAGLMRLDIEKSSVDSVYVTVWASPYLPLHMGRTENAQRFLEDHFGRQLQPPIGEKRVAELGTWVRQEFHIAGDNWNSSSVDLAASGLGWFSVGLKGEADVSVWTYDGIEVVLRNCLLPFRSNYFEVAGFTVSKIVSQADQALNKSKHQADKKTKRSESETVMAPPTSPMLIADVASTSC